MTSSRDLSSTVCVVIDGLGFIGCNLSHELIRRGATVSTTPLEIGLRETATFYRVHPWYLS